MFCNLILLSLADFVTDSACSDIKINSIFCFIVSTVSSVSVLISEILEVVGNV
jgi:hypothetical protein